MGCEAFYQRVLSDRRFASEDPIGFAAGQNLNLYVGGNPVYGRDPFGLFGWADMPLVPQSVINGAVGFGNGIITAGSLGLVNGSAYLDPNGDANPCSPIYQAAQVLGAADILAAEAGGLGQLSQEAPGIIMGTMMLQDIGTVTSTLEETMPMLEQLEEQVQIIQESKPTPWPWK
jgi:hypothetical protein